MGAEGFARPPKPSACPPAESPAGRDDHPGRTSPRVSPGPVTANGAVTRVPSTRIPRRGGSSAAETEGVPEPGPHRPTRALPDAMARPRGHREMPCRTPLPMPAGSPVCARDTPAAAAGTRGLPRARRPRMTPHTSRPNRRDRAVLSASRIGTDCIRARGLPPDPGSASGLSNSSAAPVEQAPSDTEAGVMAPAGKPRSQRPDPARDDRSPSGPHSDRCGCWCG